MDTLSVGPLHGLRVLDLSRVLAGPFCGATLGDLGAEVIKVERPTRGDDTRSWGLRVGETESTYFNAVNRNKRSVALDLARPEGQALARELALSSDVVIQNFKAGGAEKLGLGCAELQALKPELIYCSISGYDPQGSEAARLGYDLVAQGEAGLMALNGEAGRPPLKFGVAAVDLFTGMYAAQAIMAALIERGRTHKGRHIQLALFDCGLTLTAYYGLEALLKGEDPPRYGNAHPSIVPYGVFDARDGPVIITVGNDDQFRRFCSDVIGRPDLAEAPRFATNLLRSQNRDELVPLLELEIGRRSRADILSSLAAGGIPGGEVLGLGEALRSPRAVETGMVTTQPHPVAGETHVLGAPFRFDGERRPVQLRPPILGEHSDEVLGEVLGKTAEDLQALKAAGVVRQWRAGR